MHHLLSGFNYFIYQGMPDHLLLLLLQFYLDVLIKLITISYEDAFYVI